MSQSQELKENVVQPIYTHYGAVIRKYFSHGQCKGWRVGLDMINPKVFRFQDYKSRDACFLDALAHKQFLSDAHGVTEYIMPSSITEAERSYFAGFLDADGSFLVSPNNKRPNQGQIIISAGQVCCIQVPKVLQRLLHVYGGNIYTVDTSKRKHKKAFRVWRSASSFHLLPICHDVAKYGVLKAAQARLIMEYVIEKDHTNGHDLHDALMEMHREELKEIADAKRINLPWCAGIFDGNGSLTSDALCFSKLPVCVLEAINQFFGKTGIIANKKLSFFGNNRASVLQMMQPYLSYEH